MKAHEDLVRDFHTKFNFPNNAELHKQNSQQVTEACREVGEILSALSEKLRLAAMIGQEYNDHRLYRLFLMTEELGEAAEALAERNFIDLADALGDLEYVTVGTGVTYQMPSSKIFAEIHRSNMTKSRTVDDLRMRSCKKGADYSPPDLEGLMEQHFSLEES